MKRIFVLLVLLSLSNSLKSQELTFALIPKDPAYPFYQKSNEGCQQAAKKLAVKCLYLGPERADVRLQNGVIQKAIEEGVDGLAVAITQSGYLARNSLKLAKQKGIPVVTFDADFDQKALTKFRHLRIAYVGSNNFEIGYTMGEVLKKAKPLGGKIVIQTGRRDSPNLQQRVSGFRASLLGLEPSFLMADGKKGLITKLMSGQNGWLETREPLISVGREKRALKQIAKILKSNKSNKSELTAFVGMGAWAQNNAANYRKLMLNYRKALDSKHLVMAFVDATEQQKALFAEGLSHIHIAQNPHLMGYRAIELLKQIAAGQEVEEFHYTSLSRMSSVTPAEK